MAEQKSAGEKRLTKFRDFMPALPLSSATKIMFLSQKMSYNFIKFEMIIKTVKCKQIDPVSIYKLNFLKNIDE